LIIDWGRGSRKDKFNHGNLSVNLVYFNPDERRNLAPAETPLDFSRWKSARDQQSQANPARLIPRTS
jgi:hypothetical protein